MIEITGDLWEFPATARCITTNGFVRNDGHAVMGRGCAKQAARRYPALPALLGGLLKEKGNHVFLLMEHPRLYTFPVKRNWYEQASLQLIERSCQELIPFIKAGERCVIPRPGCGNGQRDWVTEVEPILSKLLDDRFMVIDFA